MDDARDAIPRPRIDPMLDSLRHAGEWDLVLGDGPVVATAIHDGHAVREALLPHLAFDDAQRRRDEDPLTGLLATVGDVRIRVRHSRFQSDLNRPREKAVSSDPADTWGLRVWKGDLPDALVEESRADHDRFYEMVSRVVESTLARWGVALVLDIHSYNHRRDGPGAAPAPRDGNPDIDLGVTTLDRNRWDGVVDRFAGALASFPIAGRLPDVRRNVRYDGGGHFPEWLHATYGSALCAISLEYKKVYMDEWTAQADIAVVEDFRSGLERAVGAVRGAFLEWR